MKKTVFFLLAAALLAGCQEKSGADAEVPARPPVVLLYAVSAQSAADLKFAGAVEPQVETEKSFRTAGRVTSVSVKAGDRIKKGEVLATVDPSALQLQVKAAEAQLQSAEAQLANVKSSVSRQDRLATLGVNSAAEREDAANNLAVAQSSLKSAQASLAKAESQMDYARIVADFDGVVLESKLFVGQYASPSSSVMTIAKPDLRDAVIDVPERFADQFKSGDRFLIKDISGGETATEGLVREVSPNANDATATYRVRIAIKADVQAFRVGSLIEATYLERVAEELVVPQSSILREGDVTSVWRFDPSSKTIGRITVELGAERGNSVVVKAGLKTGDRIVAAGVHSLKDNETVEAATEIQS